MTYPNRKVRVPRSKVTIRDVASLAGVSHQTVSRVINNSERVNPDTRIRVEAAIQQLNYRPNAIARSMALGRTSMLVCIAPNLTDYTFASIIEGAELTARERGFFLASSSAPDVEGFTTILEQLVETQRVAGMMVINPYVDERFKHLPPNFPTVFVGSQSRRGNITSIALDDVRAGHEATQHLLNLGHRKIAMITGPLIEDCSQDRCQGFKNAFIAGGMSFNPSLVIEGDWSATSGFDALMKLAENDQLPSAIFAQNDRMAIGVMRAARQLGIKVPEQLSVIGVDDMPLASYFDPPLTTMHQDMILIGQEAMKLLIECVENQDSPRKQLRYPATLIIRNSTSQSAR
jgi:LacI family transcriptional regulator, repressor for deo operon, udp, cdd, tsx, nupC, and nupG